MPRYRNAAIELVVMAPMSSRPGSPVSTAMVPRTAAPVSIWAAVATSGWPGRLARCEAYSEPRPHDTGDSRTTTRPAGSRAPVVPSAVGPTSTATPTKPMAMPTRARPGSRWPRKTRPKMVIQTGMVAMSRAVMPDGMVCSPQATKPMPPPSSRPPTMAESIHSRRDGHTKARPARATRPGQQHESGQTEPGAGHEERRDGLDRHRDGQVRAAPHDVEHEQAQPDRAGLAGDGWCWHT